MEEIFSFTLSILSIQNSMICGLDLKHSIQVCSGEIVRKPLIIIISRIVIFFLKSTSHVFKSQVFHKMNK